MPFGICISRDAVLHDELEERKLKVQMLEAELASLKASYQAILSKYAKDTDLNPKYFSAFDEELDDDEVVRALFLSIDVDNDEKLSYVELEQAIKTFSSQSEFVEFLKNLLPAASQSFVCFEDFRMFARKVPRARGERVRWASRLGLEGLLAQFLKAGTFFDGLQGLKEMTEQEIDAACEMFCRYLPHFVRRGWSASRSGSTALKIRAEVANDKFSQTAGAFEGAFGTLEQFFEGPEAFIGYPDPNLFDGMRREHCERSNALETFITTNYKVSTCPQVEWELVVSPKPHSVYPHTTKDASGHSREVRELTSFRDLETVKEAKLRTEEVIAIRLYTGPMFNLYNAKLRGFPKHLVDHLRGNGYETTLCVIISGILKLASIQEIPKQGVVYRGLGGMLLPKQFWNVSKKCGLKGGIELGLMSTTTEKSVAIQYSGADQGRPIIFEIPLNRVDMGAYLGDLSQVRCNIALCCVAAV
jgi:hypothetical protein